MAAAVRLIEPGQTVIIDDGSTAGSVARHLTELRPLTVTTQTTSTGGQRAHCNRRDQPDRARGRIAESSMASFGIACEDRAPAARGRGVLSSLAIHGAAAFHQNREVVQSKHA